MYSDNSTQQRPLVYVFVPGQHGQNGHASAPAPTYTQAMPQQQQYKLQDRDPQRQQVRGRRHRSSQPVAPGFAPTSNVHPRPRTHPSDMHNHGTQSNMLQPPSMQQHFRQDRTGHHPAEQRMHLGNVEIVSFPQYAAPAQQQNNYNKQQQMILTGQDTFHPSGSTMQTIGNQTILQPQQRQQMTMTYPEIQSHRRDVNALNNVANFPYGFSNDRNANGSSLMPGPSVRLVQPQQQTLVPVSAVQPASASSQDRPTTAATGPAQFEPNIKFLHAPPGVAIPPQPFPSYQLVPPGYHVVPATEKTNRAENSRQRASAHTRVSLERQDDDEHEEAEKLLREPMVLSGTPYSYPVKIGKDVVSGKGGRAQQYNRHFRSLINESYPRYNKTGSKLEKREIGIRIYLAIVKNGGRFLDAQGTPMHRSKAILKVMKALKDAKTWANDARRTAIQRRKIDNKSKSIDAAVATQEQHKTPSDGENNDKESPEKDGIGQLLVDEEAGHEDEYHEESDYDEAMIEEDDLSDGDLYVAPEAEETAALPSTTAMPIMSKTLPDKAVEIVAMRSSTTVPIVTETLPAVRANLDAPERKSMQVSERNVVGPDKAPPLENSVATAGPDSSTEGKARALPTGPEKGHEI